MRGGHAILLAVRKTMTMMIAAVCVLSHSAFAGSLMTTTLAGRWTGTVRCEFGGVIAEAPTTVTFNVMPREITLNGEVGTFEIDGDNIIVHMSDDQKPTVVRGIQLDGEDLTGTLVVPDDPPGMKTALHVHRSENAGEDPSAPPSSAAASAIMARFGYDAPLQLPTTPKRDG